MGADYILNPKLLVGMLAQYDKMRQSSTSQQTEVSGNGWMAGPYATVRLSENVFWQARGAWGRSNNTVSPFMTYTDAFASSRWLASTTVSGRWHYGQWSFKPSASVSFIEDIAHSYTDTYGLVIPTIKSQLGQAKIGPEISYQYKGIEDLVLEPRAGAQLIWNFAGATTAAGISLSGNDPSGPSGGRGRTELGVRATTAGGTSVDLSTSYDGLGAKGYSAVTGRAAVHVPLN